MLSIESALAIVREHTPAPRVEERPLLDARGLRLAEAVLAPAPLPAFNNSAMDGYAVALPPNPPAAEPIQLPVVGESRAGTPWLEPLPTGAAIQVSTGALVPKGADRVIPVEDTSREGNLVQLKMAGRKHDHIRFAGREVKAGAVIAGKGARLTPPALAWLGGFGIARVRVFAPPRVSLVTTGEELVDVGRAVKPGQSRNTGRVFLEDFLGELGLKPALAAHVPDSREATVQALEAASRAGDLVITVGGVSVGPHDHVKAACEEAGFTTHLWRVAQRPGKPFYFATRDGQMLFGLPGNPVSVVLTSLVYVYPALKRLLGDPHPHLPTLSGQFETPVTGLEPGRAKLFLVTVTGREHRLAQLQPGGPQQSHMLSTVTNSDGFVIIPAEKTAAGESETFTVHLFPWSELARPGNAKKEG